MAESDDDEADHEVEEMDTKNSLPPTDTLNTGITGDEICNVWLVKGCQCNKLK